MAASAKKKNKKGKTISLTDFLAEDGGTGGGSTYVPKPVSWADETDDLEGDVSTTWHSNDDDVYRAPPIDRSILPTAPRAAREPNIDRSRLPKSPPYTAFLGNLPYDVTEDSIKEFFRGLNISAVRLPREPSNPERLKGFGYAEFEDLDSLFNALSLNEESLGNRRIRVDVADQAQDKDRDDRSFGRDLHLSQRNLKRVQPPSSVLQASMPLSLWMVKMKTREKITPTRPLHSVFSKSLSTLEHSRANQTSSQTRQNKTHISWRLLNFF
uniref:Eukaryotic translation initiation factor 4B n=1 Tax=Myotis myotis TaxID=51298 RepID=A0A7J7Z2F3_MYOMY|nr:eukaryotic translation initiation factor 4B [Myotis myotis]